MVAGLAIRDPGGRPHLTRSRSHSTPSRTAVPQHVDQVAATGTDPSPAPRPAHSRSRSYLSPVEAKPRNATTLPAEPSKHAHTLRLPGTHREHKHHLRHRHTQSEARQSKDKSTDSLPHLVSRLQKEKAVAEKQQQQAYLLSRQGTSTSTSTWHSHVNNLVRIASTDPYRNMPPFVTDPQPAFGAAYYRAWDGTSTGTSTRQPTTRSQTWIELALDRASAKKELELLAPQPSDVERRQAELETAQDELRSRLADVGRQSGEIGRRLEYTYYSLLEKLSSLLGTIQSFQRLSEQSRQLIANFEERTGELHGDVRKRVGRLRGGFEGSEERVQGLEGRCERAGKKARELQTRLENVRTIVEDWEGREEQAARTWWRVWGVMFWGSVVLCSLVMGIVVYKGAWLDGRDPVAAGLGASPVVIDTRPGNHSLAMDIPEEVRDVLEGIEERRRGRRVISLPLPGQTQVINERVERARDARLRVLDEL